jgi:hypothetical protein
MTRSLWSISPDDLCHAVRRAIRTAHGEEVERDSRVYYSHGWYFVTVGADARRMYMRESLISLIHNLRSQSNGKERSESQ